MTEQELISIGFIKQPSELGDDTFQHLRYSLNYGVEIVLFGNNNTWRGQELQQSSDERMDIITIPKYLKTIEDVQTLINALK